MTKSAKGSVAAKDVPASPGDQPAIPAHQPASPEIQPALPADQAAAAPAQPLRMTVQAYLDRYPQPPAIAATLPVLCAGRLLTREQWQQTATELMSREVKR